MNNNLKILVIDRDMSTHKVQEAALKAAGYSAIRVDSIIEGICEAKTREFLFVGINADNIDYIKQLGILHGVVNAPILIGKTDFTIDEHNLAIKNGAESFGPWADTPEKNLETALTILERYRRRPREEDSREILVHKNLLVSLHHHVAFLNSVELEITPKELKILYCLMANRGMKVSFERIFRFAWGNGYEDSSRTLIWTLMTKLRQKLAEVSPNHEYIKTIRGFGYCFPA